MDIPKAVVETMKHQHRFGDWNIQLGFEQRFRCVYCDSDLLASYNAYNSWQWDHILPLSKGGEDSLQNIAVCCKACNYLKRAYKPSGASREERIADARRHVLEERATVETELTALRDLVRSAELAFEPKEPNQASHRPMPLISPE